MCLWGGGGLATGLDKHMCWGTSQTILANLALKLLSKLVLARFAPSSNMPPSTSPRTVSITYPLGSSPKTSLSRYANLGGTPHGTTLAPLPYHLSRCIPLKTPC